MPLKKVFDEEGALTIKFRSSDKPSMEKFLNGIPLNYALRYAHKGFDRNVGNVLIFPCAVVLDDETITIKDKGFTKFLKRLWISCLKSDKFQFTYCNTLREIVENEQYHSCLGVLAELCGQNIDNHNGHKFLLNENGIIDYKHTFFVNMLGSEHFNSIKKLEDNELPYKYTFPDNIIRYIENNVPTVD